MTDPDDEAAYLQAVLHAYRRTPGTTGVVRAPDRRLARDLFGQQVSLDVISTALLLASARRLTRPASALPLGPVRSLAYFLPVIAELRAAPPSRAYLVHLQATLARLAPGT